MSFLNEMKRKANSTKTMNGAESYASTGDACLDLFATAGGMRGCRKSRLIRMFTKAYIENPELAMKLLFYIRDIRGGIGERDMFRTMLRYTATRWPGSAKKNVYLIPEYGRFDDLLCLLGTPAQEEALELIKEQLEKDLKAVKDYEKGGSVPRVSLMAKWLPSANTSSRRTRERAQALIAALGLDEKSYRKMLSLLRAYSGITERTLTAGGARRVNYGAVPAGAMLKYRGAFERKDGVRFEAYIGGVAEGKQSIHCDTLFPYEILRPYFKKWMFDETGMDDTAGEAVLEALWKNRKTGTARQNALSVIDTSGSMYWPCSGKILPAVISQALGIYYAERCKGPFRNHIITFESQPHLVELKGNTLREKIEYLSTVPWGNSTNLEAVFDLILDTALETGAGRDEMPEVLYIISDMEFNCAVRDPRKSVYENARARFEAHGYRMPSVVFQNVNSWQMQTPVTAGTRGTALVSGAGTAPLGEKFDGNVTPMAYMLKVLSGKRYEKVHA